MVWDKTYKLEQKIWGEQPGELALFTSNYLKNSPHIQNELNILDVGCGYGQNALYLAKNLNCYVLGVDNSGGAIEAAQHLIDLGHQKIGFIGGPEKSPTARDRFQGFLKTMHRNGCSTDPHWIQQGDFTPVSGYRIAQELLARNPRPTAIFAANDQMAFGAVKAAKEAKLSVPEDLSIVGFDNIPLCCYFDPPLTTVEIPIYSLGYAAMGMLVNLISGKTTESLKSFKTKLVVRGSTMKQEFMRGGTG